MLGGPATWAFFQSVTLKIFKLSENSLADIHPSLGLHELGLQRPALGLQGTDLRPQSVGGIRHVSVVAWNQ